MQRVPYMKEMIPGWAGAAGGILMVVVLVVTTIATMTRDTTATPARAETPVLSSRQVAFEPQPEGVLIVRDADTGAEIAALVEADGGFVHNVVRVLTKERRRHAVAADMPYRISAYTNGRVSILDLSTGRVIDINAFGATQVESFAALL